MPLYEYRCDDCPGTFEALVPAGRADQVTCPACGTDAVHRLLSVFSSPRPGTARGSDGAALPAGGCCGGGCGNC